MSQANQPVEIRAILLHPSTLPRKEWERTIIYLSVVPHLGEMLQYGGEFYRVVNVIHHVDEPEQKGPPFLAVTRIDAYAAPSPW